MKTEIWAHRGASGYAPENTLAAFELAVRQQADGVELDVQMTRDGHLAVIHDETIDRVSFEKGAVKDYNLSELRKIRVNRTFPEYTDAVIPTLQEVYDLLKPSGITINVELKTGIIPYPGIEEAVLKATKDMGMEDLVWYSSFNHRTVKKLRILKPNVRTGVLYSDGIYHPVDYAMALGADALHPALYNMQYPDFLKECRKKEMKIHVWTVNRKEHMKEMLDMKVDAIITNYPDLAIKTAGRP